MLKIIRIVLLLTLVSSTSFAQTYPANFTWGTYVSPVTDQLRNGPCFSFAAVGATETMYRLFYGTAANLSERQVYSCGNPNGTGVMDLQSAFTFIGNSGAGFGSDYPAVQCSEATDNGPNPVILYNCSQSPQLTRRVRITYEDVSSGIRAGVNSIKSILVNKGPIALAFESTTLHPTMHAYVLYGWKTINNQTQWIFRDSYPCKANQALTSPVNLPSVYTGNLSYKAFVVTGVTEERFTTSWTTVNLIKYPFELDQESQIAKINSPGNCYNYGRYTVSGLDQIPGSTFVNWSIRMAASDYPMNASISSDGVVSGEATGVTVVATIRRPNGMLENITKYVGTVGVPVKVEKRYDQCFGTRREIQLVATAAPIANATSSGRIDLPPSPDGSYYVMNNNSSYVYVTFTRPANIDYYLYVSSSGGGCSTSFRTYRYVFGMPCYSYFRTAEAEAEIQAGSSIFPNPAKEKLKAVAVGTGLNKIVLKSLDGKACVSKEFTEATEVNVSTLQRGIYIGEISSEQGKIERKKIILE